MALTGNQIGQAFVTLTLDSKKFQRQIRQVRTQVGQHSNSLQKNMKQSSATTVAATARMTSAISGLQTSFKGLIATVMAFKLQILAVGAALILPIKAFSDLEKGVANVLTLLDKADMSKFKAELTAGVVEVARETGLAFDDISKGLFDLVSAGVPAADAIVALKESSILAVGGVTSLSKAVDGVTSIMNAYSLSTADLNQVTSAFFSAQKFGKTTVEELAGSIGRVAPVAQAAGISFQELLGTMSVLTIKGVSTEEAATGLRAVITSLIKPSAELTEKMRKLGIPVGLTEVKAAGLKNTLNALARVYKTNEDEIAAVIPNVRALTAVLSLNEESLKKLHANIEQINTDYGEGSSLLAAYEIQQGTLSQQMKIAWANVKILASSLGKILAPIVHILINAFKPLIIIIADAWDIMGAGVTLIVGFVKNALEPLIDALKVVAGWYTTIVNKSKEWLGILPKQTKATHEWAEANKDVAAESEKVNTQLETMKKTGKVEVSLDLDFTSAENLKRSLLELLSTVASKSIDVIINSIFGGGGEGASILGGGGGGGGGMFGGLLNSVFGGITSMFAGGAIKGAVGNIAGGIQSGNLDTALGAINNTLGTNVSRSDITNIISNTAQGIASEALTSVTQSAYSFTSSTIPAAYRNAAPSILGPATNSGSGGFQSILESSGSGFESSTQDAGSGFIDSVNEAGTGFNDALQSGIGSLGGMGGMGGLFGGGGGGGGGIMGMLGGLFQQGIGGLLGGMFGGGGDFFGGGSAFNAVSGAGLGASIGFGGFFAEGGRPPLGKVSVVGENGPELFVPDMAGSILPSGSSGGSVIVNNNNDFRGVDAVNRTVLIASLEATRRQTLSDVENMVTRGGSFQRAIRG